MLVILFAIRTSVAQPDASAWHLQVEHFPDILWHVVPVDRNCCWILGVHGVVLQTVNGGAYWAAVQDSFIARRTPTALAALSPQIAVGAVSTYDPWSARSFSPTDTSWILRTSDGGRSWSEALCITGALFNGIHRLGSSGVVALGNPIGDRWTVLRSLDSGKTWVAPPGIPERIGEETGGLGCTAARGERSVWFGAYDEHAPRSGSRIYHSADGGQSWTFSTFPISHPHTLDFRDSLVGVVSTTRRTIARSTDGGSTWIPVTLPYDEGSGDVAASTDGQLWLTQHRSILRSTDAGETWTRLWTVHPSHKVIMKFDVVQEGDSLFGWATTWAGGIVRFEGRAHGSMR